MPVTALTIDHGSMGRKIVVAVIPRGLQQEVFLCSMGVWSLHENSLTNYSVNDLFFLHSKEMKKTSFEKRETSIYRLKLIMRKKTINEHEDDSVEAFRFDSCEWELPGLLRNNHFNDYTKKVTFFLLWKCSSGVTSEKKSIFSREKIFLSSLLTPFWRRSQQV